MRPSIYRILFFFIILAAVSLACSLTGGGEKPAPANDVEAPAGEKPAAPEPAAKPVESDSGGEAAPSSEFPMPADAKDIKIAGNVTMFNTTMPRDDIMDFYRKELGSQDLKEDKLLTNTTDTTFSFVFKGSDKGALVIQGVDMSNGTWTVSLRYEKL